MEIKAITRRQYRASAEHRLQMVEQFRRSGLTRAAFSKQYGVPLATLSWWLTKAKRVSRLPVPVVFSEVQLTAPEVSTTNAWAMEVVAPSGLTIRCREGLTIHDTARIRVAAALSEFHYPGYRGRSAKIFNTRSQMRRIVFLPACFSGRRPGSASHGRNMSNGIRNNGYGTCTF
jgi:hypothetical protein